MPNPTLTAAALIGLVLPLAAGAQTAAPTTQPPAAAPAGAGAAAAVSGAAPAPAPAPAAAPVAAPAGAGAAAAVSGGAPAPAAPAPAAGAAPAAPAGAGAAAAVSGGAPAPAPGAAPAAGAPPEPAPATGAPDTGAAAEETDGIWRTADGNPTFKIGEDGTLDYATFAGYIRYTAECMVCHGPDGLGSTYAPALKDSVMRMTYSDFTGIVAGGRENVTASQNNVMPSFGNNNNVMCYLDDIYAYLLARGTGKLDRGRPAKKEPKSDAFKAAEDSCMG